MALLGVILKPCSECLASEDRTSLSNSTKAISLRPGTSLTSLNPGNLQSGSAEVGRFTPKRMVATHWLKSIVSIISLVSVGRFVRNRILFGASLPVGWPLEATNSARIRSTSSPQLPLEAMTKQWHGNTVVHHNYH